MFYIRFKGQKVISSHFPTNEFGYVSRNTAESAIRNVKKQALKDIKYFRHLRKELHYSLRRSEKSVFFNYFDISYN